MIVMMIAMRHIITTIDTTDMQTFCVAMKSCLIHIQTVLLRIQANNSTVPEMRRQVVYDAERPPEALPLRTWKGKKQFRNISGQQVVACHHFIYT